MAHFYELHVEAPDYGYSIGVDSVKEITEEEAIQIALYANQFDEKGDDSYVDSFEEISREMYIENGYKTIL